MQHFFSLSNVWFWITATISTAIVGAGLWMLSRWSWRWTVAAVVVVVAVVVRVVLPLLLPRLPEYLEDAPEFVRFHFWDWMLVLTLAAVLTVLSLARSAWLARREAPAGPTEEDLAGRYPELEAAWDEVLVRLAQAQIHPAEQHAILVLSPHEDWTAALIRSADLALFAEAPDGPAPVRAYATADGLFLGCAGASAFGAEDDQGGHRLERLCRLVLAQEPDCPIVRGVVVLLPLGWVGQAESVRAAAALREDLRTILRTLKLRCPVFAVFGQMEAAPGMAEFLARMPGDLRQGRCGFAVPASIDFSGDLVGRGLNWMAGWFHSWILGFLAEDPMDVPGNAQLFLLDYEFRRYRKRMRAVLESALSSARTADPPLFRGCYFAVTGEAPADQSFARGLLRGPRGRILADHVATRWTAEAEHDDRAYRQVALLIGLAGGALCLLAWFVILNQVESRAWWLGPAAILAAWVAALARILRR